MLQVFLTAVALAMDAFAVSVSSGIATRNFKPVQAVIMGLYFGAFQFIMPLVGWAAGRQLFTYISNIAPFVAFAILVFIGGKMIYGAVNEAGKTPKAREPSELTPLKLLVLAVATSIDALAVGVSFSMIDTDILFASIVIGAVAFILSVAGGLLGKKLGSLFCGRAEIAGGVILVLIGVRLLIEHLR